MTDLTKFQNQFDDLGLKFVFESREMLERQGIPFVEGLKIENPEKAIVMLVEVDGIFKDCHKVVQFNVFTPNGRRLLKQECMISLDRAAQLVAEEFGLIAIMEAGQ